MASGRELTVEQAALELAASRIHVAAGNALDAHPQLAAIAPGALMAFGGEPMEDTVTDMAIAAVASAKAIRETLDVLAENVAKAALGYAQTDRGLMPLGWATDI